LVDEDNDYANAVLDIMPNAEAFVPEIWSLEIVNTLLVAERRNRMTVEQTQASINWLQSLLITIDYQKVVKAKGILKDKKAAMLSHVESLRREWYR